MFFEIKETKGLIIDLRNYPKNFRIDNITKYLYPKRKKFIKSLMARSPGIGVYDAKNAITSIVSPFVSGGNNKDYYRGQIVLLVDRSTVSQAEFFGMAIQQSPNCITIGEQTAGAVMNIVDFNMTDNTKAVYTSMGAFYPDGTEAQRNGLKIDYYVGESATNYKPDTYINSAIQIITSTVANRVDG